MKIKYEVRSEFGEAKGLAHSLADANGIRYAIVLMTNNKDYAIIDEHQPLVEWGLKAGYGFLYVAEPGDNAETIFRNALERIAYTEHWPKGERKNGDTIFYLEQWMQAVAAKALTDSQRVK